MHIIHYNIIIYYNIFFIYSSFKFRIFLKLNGYQRNIFRSNLYIYEESIHLSAEIKIQCRSCMQEK
ncbi:hypothetical protein PFTANZ_02740 [Plasmodium falciparum Tanzania (2000708)]|uniref:Uncharacterized protein n=2 Tax=Plasmodium falciparum TaxID=5833 RepID=A0A024W7T1_PLAFA|nr:hypothetical protein PFFVO_02691 [Plasmodium falciparum Vietnam Oak-Knoll (FVO)]ETW36575.1 hypothetical protein PFTANZ_02740 [Plasmodium falciparum Tanzania (2000708)]